MVAAAQHSYARKVDIQRAISAVRAAGLDVAGVEISRDGTIRVVEARAIPQPAIDEFDRWNDRL
jgi:hypothetical protein